MSEQTSTEQTQEETVTTTEATEQVETQQEQTQATAADTTSDIPNASDSVAIVKTEETEEIGESLSLKGEDVDVLVTAALKGELTEDQQKQLEESGMQKHFDLIVKGHQARQAETDKEIQSAAGGKDEYGELINWAKSNLDDSQIESFNKAVLGNDTGIAKLAVQALKAQYVEKNGSAPSKVIQSGQSNAPSTEGFDSVQDYINETRSLEYRSNPEYQQEVEAKRARSGF